MEEGLDLDVLNQRLLFSEIDRYAFSHDEKKKRVSVYVDLPGVHGLPEDRVVVTYGARSLDLCVYDLHGINFRLKVPELYDTLEPAVCSHRVKPDKIVLTLKTGTPIVPFGSWSQLTK